ncbi:MAG: EAL domain-containing protein [Clostridia bacterium]|nr:EAL domain-containing protein [Clostridia bacterium]
MYKHEFIEKYKKLVPEILSLERDEEIFKIIEQNQDIFLPISKKLLKQISTGNASLVYQPQLSNNKCSSCEALSRFSIGDVPLSPAIAFLTASYYGFEDKLTLTNLEQLCKDYKDLKNALGSNFIISYNISPKIFNKDFCDKFYNLLEKYNINPKCIAIELLEVSSFDDIKSNTISYAKSKGLPIYLDDFGSGYSNIDTLNKFSFDCVKFDGSLISGIDKDKKKQLYLKQILEICKKRNIKTVAEKVETFEEAEICKHLGIDKIQG